MTYKSFRNLLEKSGLSGTQEPTNDGKRDMFVVHHRFFVLKKLTVYCQNQQFMLINRTHGISSSKSDMTVLDKAELLRTCLNQGAPPRDGHLFRAASGPATASINWPCPALLFSYHHHPLYPNFFYILYDMMMDAPMAAPPSRLSDEELRSVVQGPGDVEWR